MIPIVIGLLVAGYLLYNSLTDVRFEASEKGAYAWVDGNGNGRVDMGSEKDFALAPSGQGDYALVTAREMLSRIDWSGRAVWFFLLAICCLFIRVTGYVVRLRVLTERVLGWRKSLDVVLLWEFASALTPSVVGGSGVAIYFLNREGLTLGKSTAIVMVTAMMDEFFYISMVPLTMLLIGGQAMFPSDWRQTIFGVELTAEGFFWFGYLFTFLILCTLIFAVFIRPRAFRFVLLKIFSLPILRKWRYRIIDWGNDLMTTSRELKTKPLSYWSSALAATFASWTFRFILLNCLIMMVVDIPDQVVVFGKQLAMWMIMLISPTPGGSGLAEFAFLKFFGESLVPISLVGLIAILWRLLTYFPYLFAGVVILPRWLRRTAK